MYHVCAYVSAVRCLRLSPYTYFFGDLQVCLTSFWEENENGILGRNKFHSFKAITYAT